MKLPVNMHNGNLADPDQHTADCSHTRPHARTQVSEGTQLGWPVNLFVQKGF